MLLKRTVIVCIFLPVYCDGSISPPPLLFLEYKKTDLIDMIQQQNSIDPLQGGLLIQLDGKSSTITGPRYSRGLVWRRQAVHYIPKFTGMLSVLGSLYIIYHLIGTVAGRNRLFSQPPPRVPNHNNNNYVVVTPTFLATVTSAITSINNERRLRRIGLDRLLLALSIADVISSTAYIFSHWMFPSEPITGVDLGWYDAAFPHSTGTQATCVLQVSQSMSSHWLLYSNATVQYSLT
jgi:hypothetical protein